MPMPEKSGLKSRIAYMQAFAQELRDIAFHIENTDSSLYGNNGFEHGRDKLLDDCGATHDRDVQTLKKVASLFEQFFNAPPSRTAG